MFYHSAVLMCNAGMVVTMVKKAPTWFRLEWALIALATLFLSAEVGAQQHAYSHTPAGKDGRQELRAPESHCDTCLSFAPLLSGGGSLDIGLEIPHQAAGPATSPAIIAALASGAYLAFRARAPPTL